MFGSNWAGRGQKMGMGLGFRGSSPSWPYVGRGRGGLPRCGYHASSMVTTSDPRPNPRTGNQPAEEPGRKYQKGARYS